MHPLLKTSILHLLQRRGVEVTRTPSAVSFLIANDVGLVLDVGANVGQYAQGLRARGYTGAIHSFEPVPSVYGDLAKAAAGDPRWTATCTALGQTPGEAVIGVASNTVFSSIKATTDQAARFDESSRPVAHAKVPVARLDDLVDAADGTRIFLKIDTQGFEQEVLAGAGETLARCVGLQLELPIEHLYENVWTFSEALDFAASRGFVPAQIRPVNFSKVHTASAVEFDCLFRRQTADR